MIRSERGSGREERRLVVFAQRGTRIAETRVELPDHHNRVDKLPTNNRDLVRSFRWGRGAVAIRAAYIRNSVYRDDRLAGV